MLDSDKYDTDSCGLHGQRAACSAPRRRRARGGTCAGAAGDHTSRLDSILLLVRIRASVSHYTGLDFLERRQRDPGGGGDTILDGPTVLLTTAFDCCRGGRGRRPRCNLRLGPRQPGPLGVRHIRPAGGALGRTLAAELGQSPSNL